MSWLARVLLGIAVCLTLAGGARADTGLKRFTLRHDLLGFEAVGRVGLGNGFCTGVLVASDLVLTAAHCLRNAAKIGNVDDITFRAGFRDGEAIATRKARRAIMHPRYVANLGVSLENIQNDVALIELASPIPTATAAPFVTQTLGAKGRKVSVVSYARGRANALSRQAECTVVGRQQALLVFNCDVTFGSSGAPVFDTSGRRPRIVSLVSSGTRSSQESIAFGMELAARLSEVKHALRVGENVIGTTDNGPGAPPIRIKPGQSGNTGARFVKP